MRRRAPGIGRLALRRALIRAAELPAGYRSVRPQTSPLPPWPVSSAPDRQAEPQWINWRGLAEILVILGLIAALDVALVYYICTRVTP